MYRKDDKEVRKSRDQRFYEFFETLQKEWIVADLRRKIYADVVKKQKSEEIMKGKFVKIKDISIRNRLATIFPEMSEIGDCFYDEKLRERLYNEIYPETGFPNFIYRDEKHKDQLEKFDIKNYFWLGSQFKTSKGIGTLQSYNWLNKLAYIQVDGEILEFKIEDVRRIL
jgi:hypothetical protein